MQDSQIGKKGNGRGFMQYVMIACTTPMISLRADDIAASNAVDLTVQTLECDRKDSDRSIVGLDPSQENVVIKPQRSLHLSFGRKQMRACASVGQVVVD